MRFSRFWLWRVPAALALVAGAVFTVGFWLAIRSSSGSPIGAAPPAPAPLQAAKKPGKRLVLILGDSLSHGTGDPTGRGYAADVVAALERRGPVESVNLAVAGAESSDLRKLAESANVRSLAASADLILFSVGGNDLSHSLSAASAPAQALSSVGDSRARYADNLRSILRDLRDANPSAPIRLLGLYQPFGGEGRESRVGESLVLSWNSVLAETALGYANVAAVPVFDLFQGRPDRLATDRFHPNRQGYRAIADRVIQTLTF
jgi:lysophospholipase L1-like esterase